MEQTIEVRSNPNVAHETVEATIRKVLNNFPTARYSGWLGYGDDAYVIFWCDEGDYKKIVQQLTHRAFVLL